MSDKAPPRPPVSPELELARDRLLGAAAELREAARLLVDASMLETADHLLGLADGLAHLPQRLPPTRRRRIAYAFGHAPGFVIVAPLWRSS